MFDFFPDYMDVLHLLLSDRKQRVSEGNANLIVYMHGRYSPVDQLCSALPWWALAAELGSWAWDLGFSSRIS